MKLNLNCSITHRCKLTQAVVGYEYSDTGLKATGRLRSLGRQEKGGSMLGTAELEISVGVVCESFT